MQPRALQLPRLHLPSAWTDTINVPVHHNLSGIDTWTVNPHTVMLTPTFKSLSLKLHLSGDQRAWDSPALPGSTLMHANIEDWNVEVIPLPDQCWRPHKIQGKKSIGHLKAQSYLESVFFFIEATATMLNLLKMNQHNFIEMLKCVIYLFLVGVHNWNPVNKLN